jgi:asparagine synthase (glutamine-hydrolysing)
VCGIFGYVLSGPRADLPSLDGAVRGLKHRGPDGDGTFEDATGDLACGLAHTRLAIIDLSPSGRQPMTTPDGRYTITFNGEVYNYRDVQHELEAAGDAMHSGSDTEIILRAYARWGAESLHRLRGMFAFAIWDARERRLFLARDRLGVKPLYFAQVPGGLLFASEVRSLLATARVAKKLDPVAVDDYLAFGSVREPRTIVHGIGMLPAASCAELERGELRVRSYWQPPLEIDSRVSSERAIEETRALLLDAVALRLVSDVPVGVFLSGGMDSSAIVALAALASKTPVHSFTVTFDESAYDESVFAQEVARRFGAEHHRVHLSSQEALGHIDDALSALDQPSADGTNTYFVAKAAREAGLAVALSGIGGDEIFAGYPGFRRFARWTRRADLLKWLPARRGLGSSLVLPTSVRKGLALLGSRGDPFAIYVTIRGMFLAEERSALAGRVRGSEIAPSDLDQAIVRWASGPEGDAVEAYGLLDMTNYLRNTLLRDADVMGMAHALEIREPLLDHRLVERTMTVPGRWKLAHRQNKPLLARAVPELPAAASARPKMGFTLPLETWLRGPLRGWAE